MSLDLTIIIPFHNDTALLARLLERIALFQVAQHVIIVDDGSSPALDKEQITTTETLKTLDILLLSQYSRQGAGAARNLALPHVKTRHLMFMDADDLPTRDLSTLCSALQDQSFDFCLFQHHDSRMAQEALWGQMPFDQALWEQADVLHHGIAPFKEQAALHLVQTANYPWNKIYHSAFLEKHHIRCSPTLVHNDIELHWRSFFHAKTRLCSDHIGMVHFVNTGGTRLTNRRNADRFQVFLPLNRLANELRKTSLTAYRLPFVTFSLKLLLWIKDNLDPDLHLQLWNTSKAFLSSTLVQDAKHVLQSQDPTLVDAVEYHLQANT